MQVSAVASKFFPAPGPDIVAPGRIVAMTQPAGCHPRVCEEAADGYVAVAAFASAALVVRHYCVPPDPVRSVYATRKEGPGWTGSPGRRRGRRRWGSWTRRAVAALVTAGPGEGSRLYRLGRGSPPRAPEQKEAVQLFRFKMMMTKDSFNSMVRGLSAHQFIIIITLYERSWHGPCKANPSINQCNH
jgi:hypothetical protein